MARVITVSIASVLRRGLLTCVLASVCAVAVGRAQAPGALPVGDGQDLVRTKCLTCHEADIIAQQRLSRPGWVRELEKMERWGAVLTAAERGTAADYLTRHFGVASRGVVPAAAVAAATTAPEPGQAALERRCLGCHQADLVEQQRLERAGWGRELDKMVRWGAVITEAERGDLVAYLAARFGQR